MALFVLAEHKKKFDAEQQAKLRRTRELFEGLTLGPHCPGFLDSFGAFSSTLKRVAFRTAISVASSEDLLFIYSALSEEDQNLTQEWVVDLPVSSLQQILAAYFKNWRVPMALVESSSMAVDTTDPLVDRLLRCMALPPKRLREELQRTSTSDVETLTTLAERLFQRLPDRKLGKFIKLNLAVYICTAKPTGTIIEVVAQALVSTNDPGVAEILASVGKTWLREELVRAKGASLSGRERLLAGLLNVCRINYGDSLAYFETEINSFVKADYPVLVVAARAALISLRPGEEKRLEALLLRGLRNDKNQFVSEWLVRNPSFISHIRVDKTPLKTLTAVLESCRVHQPALALKLANRIFLETPFPAQRQYWQEALWVLSRLGDGESDAVFRSFVMLHVTSGTYEDLQDLLVREPGNSLLKRNVWALITGTSTEEHWDLLFQGYRVRALESTLVNFLEAGYQRGGVVGVWIIRRLIPALFADESLSPTFHRAVSNSPFLIEIVKQVAHTAVDNADFLRNFPPRWDSERDTLRQELLRSVSCGMRIALQNSSAHGELRKRLVTLSQAIDTWAISDSPRLDATLRSRTNSIPALATEPSNILIESFFQGQPHPQAEFALFVGVNPWAIDVIFGVDRGGWPKPELVIEQIVRAFAVEARLRLRAEGELAKLSRTLRVELVFYFVRTCKRSNQT